MLIREMIVDDIDVVQNIDSISFSDPWKRFIFEFELQENASAYYWVCEIDGEVIAYCGAWFVDDRGTITSIAVLPEYRNSGVGRRLMQEMLAHCRLAEITEFLLEVRVSNETAIAFYEKLGFTKKSIKENFYEDNNEDAFLMCKNTGK